MSPDALAASEPEPVPDVASSTGEQVATVPLAAVPDPIVGSPVAANTPMQFASIVPEQDVRSLVSGSTRVAAMVPDEATAEHPSTSSANVPLATVPNVAVADAVMSASASASTRVAAMVSVMSTRPELAR